MTPVVVYFSKYENKHEGGHVMPKKILVPVDIGKLTEALVDYGHSLAERLNVSVSFLHVLPHASSWVGFEKWIPEDAIKEAKESAGKKIRYYIRKSEEHFPELKKHEHPILFKEGKPAEEIIKAAKEGDFNLIIVGHKSTSGIQDMVVGSTAANIVRYAHCSVLIFRPGFDVF
jgi:nucleotide-binding universal stress UspA family protein